MTGDRAPSLARERFNDSIRWLIGPGGEGWESQFKFLPLYPKLWEALEAS